ncbi:MAG: B12-binding domain-containing radical SAM protein [Ignavibacteria bacterium]|nr:B12-binding domain-containing radical SAM protein [Ignavibacteria bacterium]MBT8382303.1 B12-binding domain-containing radical SAM protein [Ignavibacteria bacterium]MBT8391931.1 B12-binding domain-containing radical SAM protein [Ignavibacteria bacterium]NNJ52206.1 B12-binding domain-containing radical SAM protein [Ignavibacteriaceae bacterium]NNL21751.1 B12-binding domain-containing radical SAM protein [Ignavibacteriaceae bacterium]
MINLLGKRTRCLLIHPKFSPYSFWNFVDVSKIVGAKYLAAPLGLMTVAALLPQEWEIKLIDTNVEPLLDEHFEWADLVFTGGMLPQQIGILDIITLSHQRNKPVVVGGPDPTSQPNLYQSADYLVLGEGEITIPMLLNDLEKGCKSGEHVSSDLADMTKAVVPRFDLIKFNNYLHLNIQFTRGCPFNCEFCDVIELYGRKPRSKTPEQIIKELQSLYDLDYRGHVDIVDDNFIGNKKNVKTILQVIKGWSEINNYPFYYGIETSINLADDDELLQMMKDVDFRLVFIGIETPEDDVLEKANKKINMNRSIIEATRKISSYGIIVNAGFIIGFDNEGDQTAQKMIDCIQASGICVAMFGLMYALPNTQLTKRLKLEGRLFNEFSIFTDNKTQIDQSSSGLNFATLRPRIDILRDFVDVLEYIYKPEHYYERIIRTCLNLKIDYKHKHSFIKILKNLRSFIRITNQVGFNRVTGKLYWKMLFCCFLKNPTALEWGISLSAMFIHFYKHSKFIIKLTNQQINFIKKNGEDIYNQRRLTMTNSQIIN